MLEGLEEVPHGSLIGSTTHPNAPVLSGFASNHFKRRQLEDDFEDDDIEQQIYRPPNPFDEELDSGSDHTPQSYQIRTGSRRGLLNQGYSSEESLEPSMLSVIPEESILEVQMAESHDLLQQSHDLLQQSHYLLQQSHGSQIKPQEQKTQQEDTEVPWYQDTSQDDWQTTPSYHREEVRPEEVKAVHKKPAMNKLVVTEELKPVLQVSVLLSLLGPVVVTLVDSRFRIARA